MAMNDGVFENATETINTTFAALKKARTDLYKAFEATVDAQRTLTVKKITIAPQVNEGKNETERKNIATALTMEEAKLINAAEDGLALAQLNFDLASYEVSRVKLLVNWVAASTGS